MEIRTWRTMPAWLAGITVAVGLLLPAAVAQAQVVIFEESFNNGLGQFTSTGTVTTGTFGARMQGGNNDGMITSGPISTQGFTGITLSFNRVTTGLDFGESGIASFSIDGTNFTTVESIRTASGRVSFNLGATAEGQSQLRLRFRVNASLTTETYDVDDVRLEGTAVNPNPTPSPSPTPTPGPSPTPTPPPTGNPFQRGPDPTVSVLEAASGPFAVATTTVAAGNGFGGGTIYFPTSTTEGPFAAIAVAPGFTERQSAINWWGPRLASNGFVVIAIDTNSTSDQPPARATQLIAALKQVVALSGTSGNAILGKVDATRLGVMGHSMGGGGTLLAARDNPTLKGAIPFAPWNNSTTDFSAVKVPTLVIACQNDSVAPVNTHAVPFYNSFSATLDKAYLEIAGGSHSCANSGNANTRILGKYGVAWMKRFMDNDTRYDPFLCGAPHQTDLGGTVISQYREDCPY